jgi:hypothetical protein
LMDQILTHHSEKKEKQWQVAHFESVKVTTYTL